MDSRDKVIEELRALVAKQSAQIEQQSAQIEQQSAQIEKLTARIGELELQLAKAKKDSTTSSKPPSSDIAKPKPKQRPGLPKKPRQRGSLVMSVICESLCHQSVSTKRSNTKSMKQSGSV